MTDQEAVAQAAELSRVRLANARKFTPRFFGEVTLRMILQDGHVVSVVSEEKQTVK